MEMLGILERLNHCELSEKVNFKKIPINVYLPNDESINEFNEIYLWVKKNVKNKIKRTPSGGISYSGINFKPPMWDVEIGGTWIGLTIVTWQGCWRIQMRFGAEDKTGIYGGQSFAIFKKKLAAAAINLDDYAIDNGEEVKKEIEKPLIKLEHENLVKNMIFEGVHHIDFHNSYPAGLVNTHPEFKEVITELYEKRKVNEKYKAILNHSIGYMQSLKCCDAKWAHLSRDAIKDNNDRIRDLAKRLKENGRTILAYNTDGIWYVGDVFHGEGEGKNLGEWENDHVNCRWRAKSAGCYEYEEDGVYKAVVRGKTMLDRMKPRDHWVWGDIYNKLARPIIFLWDENIGIIQIKEEYNEDYSEQSELWFTL